jgi:CubicO group peptidase (beta-lactamase class C family)
MQFRTSIPMTSLFIISIFLFPNTLTAQVSKADQIDEVVTTFSSGGYFSGVVLASEDGRMIYEKAFGLANADFDIPNRPDTVFGIASITKPMTDVILARLVEKKKIAPEDKLSKFLPDFPDGDKITIEMLASHMSGIPHRVMPPEFEATAYTSAEMVRKIAEAKLDFEPGTKRSYSSAGYTVLTRALEIASGETYAQLLNDYVFTPAGMKDSQDFNSETIIKRRAQDYFLRPTGIVNAPQKDYSFLIGAGSVFGTASDLMKFGNALLDGKYDAAARKALVENEVFSSSGRTNGHRAYVEIDRGKRYGFVVVSNLSSGAFDLITKGLSEILTGKPLTAKGYKVPKLDTSTKMDLSEFEGIYKRPDGGQFDIVLKDGVLHSSDIGIYPVGKDCFFDYSFFGSVCFGRDDTGKVNTIVWKGTGFELKGQKQ